MATTRRNFAAFKLNDQEYAALVARARAEQLTYSELIRRALVAYGVTASPASSQQA